MNVSLKDVFMIARLSGEVVEKGPHGLVLDVHGVGYAVSVVDERLYAIQQTVTLHVYCHWNQENGPQLYAFGDVLSKTVFAHILTCNGCGPKIGLSVLAHMSAKDFLRAITLSDVRALNEVSGIGAKKAELMIMQLKDKVSKIMVTDTGPGNDLLIKIKQVQEALAALRYKPSEISSTLDYLHANEAIEASNIDELLRKGLSFLAKRL